MSPSNAVMTFSLVPQVTKLPVYTGDVPFASSYELTKLRTVGGPIKVAANFSMVGDEVAVNAMTFRFAKDHSPSILLFETLWCDFSTM